MLKKILFLITILLYPSFVFSGEVSKLFNQGSYDAAFRTGYADALAGDPESSYIIGRIFIEGRGSGKENINKGIQFLDSSAKSDYLKAVEFLGDNYYKGDFTSEDKSLALKYYEQAEKLGSRKVSEKVTELRFALLGKISKKSCVRYNKKNKKHYFKIAECISRDFLDGNASSFYLMAFDNGSITGKENIEKSIEFLKTSAQSGDLKAAEFLGNNYYDGQFTSKNKSLALKYYEQAEKLGSRKVSEKVTELRFALLGKISKKSCVRYNKKNKKHYFKIAECISRDFLDGNASSYYLMAFDNGNTGAYLKASQRMLRVKDIDLMPLVKRIPAFKDKANKSEQQRFIKQIKRFGYDGSFCGKTEIKSTKKDIFAKPKKSTSSNSAACALAAEAGDAQALPIAYEWWKNGSEGFPRSSRYAQGLIDKLEENEDVDVVRLLRKFESNPKKHFRKAMEYISANPLNLSQVSKELKLEIGMIADKNYMAFASNYRDIADAIEYIDWKSVDTQTLAKFYISYYFDLLLNHKHGGELTTPRVKNNINKIPYKKSFISSLGKMEGGGELANTFLTSRIYQNCDALKYAIKKQDELDIPFETIEDARKQSLQKCDFAVAKKSMKELLKIAKRDLNLVKIFIEKRLNHRLPCKDYSDFLQYNENDPDDFDVDYEKNNEFCSTFPIVSYKLAIIAYQEQLYDEAYQYALQGCENEDHKSKGCDLLAMIIIEGKSIETNNMDYDQKMMEAIGYVTTGHENGDINSTAFLHNIVDKPILFSKFADTDLAKELLLDLENSKQLSAQIEVQKTCFSADPLKSLFKNCEPVCAWAKRKNKSKNIDVVSRYLLQSIFEKNVCKPKEN